MLMRMGREVTVANNGLEALKEVRAKTFDLVLMDIHMPQMDGLEALQQVRELDGPVSKIPIIALTANAMKGDREKYIVAGMYDYVAKPINTTLLSEALIKATGMASDFQGGQAVAPAADRDDIAADAQNILDDFDSILER